MRGSGVDRRRARETADRLAGRVQHRFEHRGPGLAVTGVGGTDAEAVLVVVRGAGHLPEAVGAGVRLARRTVAEGRVGLGHEHEDRHTDIVPDGSTIGSRMQQEPVVHVGERVNGVDVGRQQDRRLRYTRSDEMARMQTAQQRAGVVTHGLPGLRADVVREVVTRVRQTGVGMATAHAPSAAAHLVHQGRPPTRIPPGAAPSLPVGIGEVRAPRGPSARAPRPRPAPHRRTRAPGDVSEARRGIPSE